MRTSRPYSWVKSLLTIAIRPKVTRQSDTTIAVKDELYSHRLYCPMIWEDHFCLDKIVIVVTVEQRFDRWQQSMVHFDISWNCYHDLRNHLKYCIQNRYDLWMTLPMFLNYSNLRTSTERFFDLLFHSHQLPLTWPWLWVFEHLIKNIELLHFTKTHFSRKKRASHNLRLWHG